MGASKLSNVVCPVRGRFREPRVSGRSARYACSHAPRSKPRHLGEPPGHHGALLQGVERRVQGVLQDLTLLVQQALGAEGPPHAAPIPGKPAVLDLVRWTDAFRAGEAGELADPAWAAGRPRLATSASYSISGGVRIALHVLMQAVVARIICGVGWAGGTGGCTTRRRRRGYERGTFLSEKPFSELVVVGPSAGGTGALSRLIAALPEDFPVPVFVAQHPGRDGHLTGTLSRHNLLLVRTGITDSGIGCPRILPTAPRGLRKRYL